MNTIYTSNNKIRKGIFLDRDGVINRNYNNYVQSTQSVQIIPKSLEAIAELTQSEYVIVIVTNQSAIGRGIISQKTSEEINSHLLNIIQNANGRIDGVYVCPHHPQKLCNCRKPKPGMLLQASKDLNINLNESWLIGDAISDIQAALSVNVTPLLVKTGRGAEQFTLLQKNNLEDTQIFNNLYDATEYILKSQSN